MIQQIGKVKKYSIVIFCLVLVVFLCRVTSRDINDSPLCTVDMRVEINQLAALQDINFSVIKVKPHMLRSEECKKFAELLFGDSANFYETDYAAFMTRVATEEEIQKLERLSLDDVITDIYGAGELGTVKRAILETIEVLRNTMRTETRDNTRKNCNWEFQPESYYLSNLPDAPKDDGNRVIMAYVENDATSYKLWITSRDEADYRIQAVDVYLSSEYSSPYDIETLHMLRRLCGNRRPSDTEVEAAVEKAISIVKAAGFGDWVVVDSRVEVYKYWRNNEKPLYVVNVTAVPCYDGVNLLHLEQLEVIKGSGVLSDYYYSELMISLSPSGELVEVSLTSPLDIVSVAEAKVDVIDSQQSMDSLSAYLDKWGAAILQNEGFREEDGYTVHAIIDDVKWGYARVNTKDQSGDFLLVPALQFHGDYAIMRGDKLIYSYRDLFGSDYEFALINLTDGSIINSIL